MDKSIILHCTSDDLAEARVPVVPLNLAAISQQTSFSRDIVEGCIRETLAALHQALASEKNVCITFKGIGVLCFKNNKVQMKFSRDFINTVSETHKMLTESGMRARSRVPLLSGDVIELQRPMTAGRVILPTIRSYQTDNNAAGKDDRGFLPSGDQRIKEEVPQQREFKSNQSLQMKAGFLTEELNPTPPVVATSSVLHGEPPRLDQHLKNVSCPGQILAGQAKLTEQCEQANQVAAFNLQMSKREKSSCSDCPRSFVFPARPITPPKRIQQHRYMSDLQSQMERRQKLEAQSQQYHLLTEQLDQIQLIQEIAVQRAQQFQQKQEKAKHYRKALVTQVEDKMFTASPEYPPHKPRLTRCETAIRRAESRERAQKLFQVNFSVATQRKKEEMQSRQLQLEKEKEILQHTKIELRQDNTNQFEEKRNIRKSLEDDWNRSVELKHKREDEERRFLRSAGQLLIDKLEECRCCRRCKRRTTNCGETNIWKDSFYSSGSQFMI
ncbi:coiled-coil domain-containing protein 81-like [Anableps anableps]